MLQKKKWVGNLHTSLFSIYLILLGRRSFSAVLMYFSVVVRLTSHEKVVGNYNIYSQNDQFY